MKKFLQNKILHPFLITIFPALFLFSNNLGETKFRIAIPSILVILASSLFLILIFWLIFKNIIKAGIFSSLILFSFLTYQYFRPFFTLIGLKTDTVVLNWIACAIWIIILIFLLYLILKSKKLILWNYFLNNASLIMLASFLIMIGFYPPSNNKIDPKKASAFYQDQISIQKQTTDKMPDIYYMILDGYGRSDILNSKHHFDNSQFINFLKDQGFYVADKSTTNYGQTTLSLSSSMNLNYLETLKNSKNTGHALAGALVSNSALISTLEKLDYHTIGFSSDYEFTQVTRIDENKAPNYWSEFNQLMLKKSVISDISFINKPLLAWLSIDRRSKTINYLFDHVADDASLNLPKFTFFHIIAPHPPFIFDKTGLREDLDLDKIVSADCDGYREQTNSTAQDYQINYSQQVEYVNQKVQEVVTKIIKNSKRPVVIILQGDHGPGSECDLTDITKTDLPERMSILNAYYFSDQKYGNLYPEISPVNTFRVIFNQYFDADLPLLEDKNYFSLWNTPYQFIDVTEKVNK